MQIGEILREAREEQGLSLDNIQEMTKIQKRYLVAIEHDDFHALPGRFYARAFIKEYAQAVGLDPAIVLEDFDEESIQEEQHESVQYTRFDRSKRSQEKGTTFLSFLPTVIVIVLVIGIIFVAYTLLIKSSNNGNSDVETPQENDEIIRNKDEDAKEAEDEDAQAEEDDEETATDEEENEESDETGQFEVVEVGEGSSPLSTIDFNSDDDEIIVQLEPTAETYVQLMDENEQVIYEGSLNEATELDDFDVSDTERIYLNIGNAPSLVVKLNGDELEYPVDQTHQKYWINLKKEE